MNHHNEVFPFIPVDWISLPSIIHPGLLLSNDCLPQHTILFRGTFTTSYLLIMLSCLGFKCRLCHGWMDLSYGPWLDSRFCIQHWMVGGSAWIYTVSFFCRSCNSIPLNSITVEVGYLWLLKYIPERGLSVPHHS